jgi:succinoglycan biosynthesis protein ExoW
MASVYIIIPYYQETPGTLRGAVESVLSQTHTDWHLLVADDASPAPAQDELIAAGIPDERYTLITGANGGPAVARNRALEAVPDDASYVAFLDSDDSWSCEHLASAIAALEKGFDFYFANHLQLNATVAAFERAGRINPDAHSQLDCLSHLYSFDTDLFDQILTGNVIGTSTVVYAFQRFPQHRFQAQYRNAGEDYLFWLDLCVAGCRAAFSTAVEATYGVGVNVYAGSGWGTKQHLDRLADELVFARNLPLRYELSTAQDRHVRNRSRLLRVSIAADIAHRLAKRKPIPIHVLKRILSADPLALALLPWYLAVSRLTR